MQRVFSTAAVEKSVEWIDRLPAWTVPATPQEMERLLLPTVALGFCALLTTALAAAAPEDALWEQARENSVLAGEGFSRARRYVDGWLAHADPGSGLIPRNLNESRYFWNGRDAGADNYSFMVLTAAMTDRELLEGRLLGMLRSEARLTARVDRLVDDYSFTNQTWRRKAFELDAVIFDSAEYVKDGLLTITEWMGKSPWSERMIGIVDDIWKHAPVETPAGKIPTQNFEVNGDLLQVCSRLYWFTGNRKYLEWAVRIGDYYLLGTNHPTRDLKVLALGDHSCEVINGLSELYFATSGAWPEKREAYRVPIHLMFDRILRVGVDTNGLMYQEIETQTGKVRRPTLTDNFGYNYDGFYTVYLADGTVAYRDATRRALVNLKDHYTGYVWERGSADGYADAIEGALNLYNRERIASAADWMDSEIITMWNKQRPDGVIEGWHGDGNFARTSLMYALWKTQGITISPWREDVRFGAVAVEGKVMLHISAEKPWSGKVIFDRPRHRLIMRMPVDYPRINQFPEWFTVSPRGSYTVANYTTGREAQRRGSGLIEGYALKVGPGESLRLTIRAETTP